MSASAPINEPDAGLAVSLAFWLMLAAAAALFATVSLSPKLTTYLDLEEQFCTQQQELLDLERQHADLNRVIAALKDDAQFAAEMARLEFDAVRPGEEILSVEAALALEPQALQPAAPQQQATRRPIWHAWLATLAYYQPLRTILLAIAATLILIGFGWMQDRAPA
jgi:cell division protein FtsB